MMSMIKDHTRVNALASVANRLRPVNVNVRMAVCWPFAMPVNLIGRLDRYHDGAPVSYTTFGDHLIGALLHVGCATFEHRNFQAALVIEMNM